MHSLKSGIRVESCVLPQGLPQQLFLKAITLGCRREGCNMAWLMTNECVGYTLVHIQLATSTMHGICHLSPNYSAHSMPST